MSKDSVVARRESVHWQAHARVDTFNLEQIEACRVALGLDREPIGRELLAFCQPMCTVTSVGNLMTRQGKKRLMDRFVSTAAIQVLDATHCRIGVGDSNTAAADTDTDLGAASGSAHRQFQLVDTAPTSGSGANSGVLTVVATFGTSVANFHWLEWGIDGGSASGTTVTTEGNTTPGLINHKVVDLGSKTSAQSSVFTVTITVS